MILPPFLRPGARVALLAPSGPVPEERLAAATECVRALGLAPQVYESCRAQHGYLAGSDATRAANLNAAFADDTVQGVICIRGGYGAHRLMPLLDWDTIAANPKPLYGYSDVTALHIQLNQRCGMASWHTPMPSTEWCDGLDDYTTGYLQAALFGPMPAALANPPGAPLQTLCPGLAEGRVVGGNLSLVAATLGTPYEIDTRGKILFLEDVDEEPYCIDRMLLQLRHAGKLDDCAGLLLGPFTNCVGKKEKKTLTLEQVFDELLPKQGKPVLAGLQCGHVLPTLSLPLGAVLRLDAAAQTIEVLGVA